MHIESILRALHIAANLTLKGKKMLTLTAIVRSVFAVPEGKDKDTGEVFPAGSKVQLEYEEIAKGGDKKIVLKDFNVNQMGDLWRKAIGKHISVAVNMYVDTNGSFPKPALTIPKGSIPTLAA